ncbi:MBL fold metallo-hydrolase [Nakamurella antarctica]|nr:MBL fold metallo-hydrolase [Nakamurella antarctica]
MTNETNTTEVAPGLMRIVAPIGERFIASYLFRGEEASLIVDTGFDSSAREVFIPALESLGVTPESLKYVVSTHCDFDHTGGNAAFREWSPNATFVAGEADRHQTESVEALIVERYGELACHGVDETEESKAGIRAATQLTRVDVGMRGEETFRLSEDWKVCLVHTPGHSYGSVSIWDPRSRAFVIGDAVLGATVPLANGEPAFPPTYRYLDDYLATVALVRKFAPALLLTSHYRVMDAEAATDFLDETTKFVDELQSSIDSQLAEGPQTLTSIINGAAPLFGPWDPTAWPYLGLPVYGHVERMQARGELEIDHSTTPPTVRSVAGVAS